MTNFEDAAKNAASYMGSPLQKLWDGEITPEPYVPPTTSYRVVVVHDGTQLVIDSDFADREHVDGVLARTLDNVGVTDGWIEQRPYRDETAEWKAISGARARQ